MRSRRCAAILDRMKTFLASLAFLSSFAACAEPVACADAKACELMWSRAQDALSGLASMRIRLLTPERIETYAPFKYNLIGAVIVKRPIGNAYEIELRTLCHEHVEAYVCADIAASQQIRFADALRAN